MKYDQNKVRGANGFFCQRLFAFVRTAVFIVFPTNLD
jgi:hypothetical protein